QIKEATFYGFDGSIRGITTLESSVTKKQTAPTNGELALVPAGPLLPFLKLGPKGGIGAATLELKPGVTLSGTPDGLLRVVSRAKNDTQVVLQPDGVALKGDRYGTRALPPSVTLVAAGRPPGVFTQLHAMNPQGAQIRADIAFVEAAGETALLDPKQT